MPLWREKEELDTTISDTKTSITNLTELRSERWAGLRRCGADPNAQRGAMNDLLKTLLC